jgi:hypothetical protein
LNSLKQLASNIDLHAVILPSGIEVQVPRWTIRFPAADPERLPQGSLGRTYTIKPLVDVDGEPLFGELAIVRWLQKDGWDAVWVDAFHSSTQRKLFWQGLPDRTQPYDLAQVPAAYALYLKIVELNGGRVRGFFDVLAWRDERFLFAEYKSKGDRPKKNEKAWIDAALRAGVRVEDLLYVVHP